MPWWSPEGQLLGVRLHHVATALSPESWSRLLPLRWDWLPGPMQAWPRCVCVRWQALYSSRFVCSSVKDGGVCLEPERTAVSEAAEEVSCLFKGCRRSVLLVQSRLLNSRKCWKCTESVCLSPTSLSLPRWASICNFHLLSQDGFVSWAEFCRHLFHPERCCWEHPCVNTHVL